MWALEKVYQGWVGTGSKSKLLAELESVLAKLISDQSKEVRLRTAKLWSLIGSFGSAEELLAQHTVEQDGEVKIELFVALGAACYDAFSVNSGVEIDYEIRGVALELAAVYLADGDANKAQRGADVIKKLLELNGLEDAEVDNYFGLLVKRYKDPRIGGNGRLQGELLNAMAGLCAKSVYKGRAARVFGPLFEEALGEQTDLVREAAASGLIYIDSTKALGILRDGFVDDSVVVEKLIDLAGKVGGEEDLEWLSQKVGKTAESDLAWGAMIKIFKRSESAADLLEEWVIRYSFADANSSLSDEQKVSFFAIAERKAIGEEKDEMLRAVRGKLAELYLANREYDRAAEYWGLLLGSAQLPDEKELIRARLLEAYFKKPNIKMGKDLIENRLLESDLEAGSVIVKVIDDFLANPVNGVNPKVVLKVLSQIKPPKPRPMWQNKLQSWRELLGKEK